MHVCTLLQLEIDPWTYGSIISAWKCRPCFSMTETTAQTRVIYYMDLKDQYWSCWESIFLICPSSKDLRGVTKPRGQDSSCRCCHLYKLQSLKWQFFDSWIDQSYYWSPSQLLMVFYIKLFWCCYGFHHPASQRPSGLGNTCAALIFHHHHKLFWGLEIPFMVACEKCIDEWKRTF